MRLRKIIIVALFLCLLLIGSVSAASDNDTLSSDVSEKVQAHSDTHQIDKSSNDDVKSDGLAMPPSEDTTTDQRGIDNENEITYEGTFDDLSTEINAVEDRGTLNLTKNYKYANGSTLGITINKPITIDGQGHIIDGNYLSKIFYITGNDVKMRNIIFRGGNEDYLTFRAAHPIVLYGINGYFKNCTFENSSYYLIGNDGIISDCNFYNKGINFHGDNCKLINSIFINCSSPLVWYGEKGTLLNCTFENCSSGNTGGAIYWTGKDGNASGCSFINCSVMCPTKDTWGYGGAIFWYGASGYLSKCNFENCYIGYSHSSITKMPIYGGAICWKGGDGKLSDCNFTNCIVSYSTSEGYGNAIYWEGDDGKLFGCNFIDCIVSNLQNSHHAVFWYGENGIITNNYFNPDYNSIIIRMNTNTNIEEIQNLKVNQEYKLKVNIHDEDGKLVKEGIVQVYLDGVDIGSIDLSKNNGQQSTLTKGLLRAVNPNYPLTTNEDNSELYIKYTPTQTGKHTLLAVYKGTIIYKTSNQETTFFVQENDPTNPDTPTNPTNPTNPDTGNNNQDSVTPTTGSSNTVSNEQTNKETIKITSPTKATFKSKVKTKKYSATIKNKKGKAIKSAKVTLKIGKKTYKAKTNKKGKATFKITNLKKKGKYTAVITYKGIKRTVKIIVK